MPTRVTSVLTPTGEAVPIVSIDAGADFKKGTIDGTAAYFNLSAQDGDSKVWLVAGDAPFYMRIIEGDDTGAAYTSVIAAGGDRVVPCLAGQWYHIATAGKNVATAATILEFIQWGAGTGTLTCIRV